MSLFKKKKEEPAMPTCCCNAPKPQDEQLEGAEEGCCCGGAKEQIKSVKVLGMGCASCHTLYENACEAVKEAGFDVEVEYVTDMEKIMAYGVMSVPALVVNECVVSAGKVLKTMDIIKLLA